MTTMHLLVGAYKTKCFGFSLAANLQTVSHPAYSQWLMLQELILHVYVWVENENVRLQAIPNEIHNFLWQIQYVCYTTIK